MTAEGRRLELKARREPRALFLDSIAVLGRHFGVFVVLAAVVVVPVHVIVSGIGLEQLTGRYDSSPSRAAVFMPALVSFLVITPLVTAICIHVLRALESAERPSARQALVEGFEAFTPLFFAVLLAAAGITLGLIFIVPGIYLAVRWSFVPQAVVIEGVRGPQALARSMKVTEGFWWRTFLVLLAGYLLAAVAGLVVSTPFTALAQSSDRAVWSLAGSILTQTVTTPFVALLTTFLYYDLRTRRS